MATHHLTAVDLTATRGWQPIVTFPRDGTIVEVRDAEGHIVKAFWKDGNMAVGVGTLEFPALGDITHWRHQEKE